MNNNNLTEEEKKRRKEIKRLKANITRAFNQYAKSQGYSDFKCYKEQQLN